MVHICDPQNSRAQEDLAFEATSQVKAILSYWEVQQAGLNSVAQLFSLECAKAEVGIWILLRNDPGNLDKVKRQVNFLIKKNSLHGVGYPLMCNIVNTTVSVCTACKFKVMWMFIGFRFSEFFSTVFRVLSAVLFQREQKNVYILCSECFKCVTYKVVCRKRLAQF